MQFRLLPFLLDSQSEFNFFEIERIREYFKGSEWFLFIKAMMQIEYGLDLELLVTKLIDKRSLSLLFLRLNCVHFHSHYLFIQCKNIINRQLLTLVKLLRGCLAPLGLCMPVLYSIVHRILSFLDRCLGNETQF